MRQEDMQRVQAAVVVVGLLTVVCVGALGCIALVAALFYVIANFVLLMLQSTIELSFVISSTWVNVDPGLKLLVLVAVAYCVYHRISCVGKCAIKRGGRA